MGVLNVQRCKRRKFQIANIITQSGGGGGGFAAERIK